MKRVKPNYKKSPFKNSVAFYYNGWRSKGLGHIAKSYIRKNDEWVNTHKIFVPKAIGTGDSKTDHIKPFVPEKNSCCSETYIIIGPFSKKNNVTNALSYINTKFFHFLVTLKKNTQEARRAVYDFVPIQDFTESWTDEKLYKKYGLTKKEIAYIESMIRPMESDNE